MPDFDGTGPRGQGPMTGRGEGHCALVLPPPGSKEAPYGYAGLQGTPVRLGTPAGLAGLGARFPCRWPYLVMRRGLAFRHGRGHGAWRGRWFARW
jgi:hypothetical protein